ncbi:MAG: hypothetical protein H0T73_14050, partial [Ardenticatenales bacterium]|nr:hypothetical protein [Ardenticatenales bacterium]
MRPQSEHSRQLEFDNLLPTPASGTSFNDPAFASNKTLPIHRWVPWIAGFSSDFVQDALERYLPKKGVVLDPFAGVGTTLVEAVLAGHETIGFEINPYAALASRTKLQAANINVAQFRTEIEHFLQFYDATLAAGPLPLSKP